MRDALETGATVMNDEDYMLEDGLVCYRRRVWIPEDNGLKVKIARSYHDHKVAGHFGREKTLELIKRNYY